MVVTVTRLEPGHCTAVSYDSHAWWGSCERPMSDVTSLVRCAQPQAPLAQPCHARVVSSRVPLKTHTQPTVLHGPWGAWHGPAWSGQAIPADALLGVSFLDSTCNTSQAAGILERMNKRRLRHMLHPLFPSDCQLRWLQHTHIHAHRLSSGQKAHCHRDGHLVTLSPCQSAATLPRPRLTDGALGRPSVRCLGKLQLKRPAATQMHEH